MSFAFNSSSNPYAMDLSGLAGITLPPSSDESFTGYRKLARCSNEKKRFVLSWLAIPKQNPAKVRMIPGRSTGTGTGSSTVRTASNEPQSSAVCAILNLLKRQDKNTFFVVSHPFYSLLMIISLLPKQ